MNEEDNDAAIAWLEAMGAGLAATIEQAQERHKPLVAEVNALLASAGSEKRFTSDNFCVSDVLWALIPIVQRLVDRTNN